MMKNLRRAVQWTVFAAFCLSFLSFIPGDGAGFLAFLPKTQLFPALRRFPAALIIILTVTWLFGRLYCSTLCPLATVQDILIGRNRLFSYRKLSLSLRYLVPLISLTALFAGFPAIASLVDPYSLTGRIVSSVNELVVLPSLDLAGLILRQFSLYITTFPLQLRWITILGSAVSLSVLIILSRIGGRLYCNTLCPVGALLSVFSRWSLFAHRIDTEKCTSCGACERVCKAEAIDVPGKHIDTSQCVSCFNCTDVCRFDALTYSRKKKISSQAESAPHDVPDKSRRDFLKRAALGSAVTVGVPLAARSRGLSVLSSEGSSAAVPPGSLSRSHFLSKCTSCSLCISRCPGRVLQPAAFSQYGMTGVGVPYMDHNRGSCEFECSLCSSVCPSGAIEPLVLENKKQVKIGEARFIRKFCVVETDGTSCGACGEICPTGAIDMLLIGCSPDGELEIPVIHSQYCIGCGACQFVCPVKEKNAIFVEALGRHVTAEVREETPAEPQEDSDNDFAF